MTTIRTDTLKNRTASTRELLGMVLEELEDLHVLAYERATALSEAKVSGGSHDYALDTHGDPAGIVQVSARGDDAGFELSVANQGTPTPPETIERLFQPFSRASDRPGSQGLGLGLYIASEIARGHGGALEVESDAVQTRFTFRMPNRSA